MYILIPVRHVRDRGRKCWMSVHTRFGWQAMSKGKLLKHASSERMNHEDRGES